MLIPNANAPIVRFSLTPARVACAHVTYAVWYEMYKTIITVWLPKEPVQI